MKKYWWYHKIDSIYKKINNLFPEKGIVVMFHRVTDKPTDVLPCCVCSNIRFKEIIKELSEKYTFIDISDLFKENRKIIAVITFDDCYEDVYLNAYPILKKQGIPFTLFISSRLINQKDYITWEQILEMEKDPLVTIGYHTNSHSKLIECKDKKEEIITSKYELENKLSYKINYFAYPFGKLYEIGVKSIFQASKEYSLSFGTANAKLTAFSMFFKNYLPRITIQ